ncbi:MFS transporter [Sanguibacter suaedae]|uniref:MFS transporter n=1 Tax=Sanguibacter suaedae TaxID=2795737 RepID=A0A934I884_9MICO|nr:MFS transporter [Sanguibacter suaedae]MBI9113797.1 MFS transporter [Sanguibacter suaedae]
MSFALQQGPRPAVAYLAAAAFGSFWGAWGASIPRIREQAGVDDGQLGVALLFVGAGALPAMLLAGKALDRFGLRFAGVAIIALGMAGVGAALSAHGFVALCLGLTVVGATSGATDVAMNSIAARAEQVTGRAVIMRAGGVFSVFVVLSSLGTGLLSALGAPTYAPFLVIAVLSVVASAGTLLPRPGNAADPVLPRVGATVMPPAGGLRLTPLLIVGVLGALAFASENAHQSWGAVFLEDELNAGTGTSAVAPAVFAAVVAATRLSLGTLRPGRERSVVLLGSVAAAAGALIIAASPTILVAALGLIVAAAGTATLYPTMLSLASRSVDEAYRGRATALVTAVSYLGFLLGPVYVGLWSQGVGLRGAMVAVAGLGVALTVLTVPLLGLAVRTTHGSPSSTDAQLARRPQ